MESDLKELKPRNIFAIGLTGFSGAFAFFLLRELLVDRAGLVAVGLNLSAAVLLIVVCAVAWPRVSSPASAQVSWKAVVLATIACVLAVLARVPALHT